MISKENVVNVLRTVMDPELDQDIVSLNMVREISIENGLVSVDVMLTTPACPLKHVIQADIERALLTNLDIKKVAVHFLDKKEGQNQAAEKVPLSVKKLIAVGSGKGGVGKTTVAVNLAVSLAQKGLSVGLLDADIYGPNVPTMLGSLRAPEIKDGRIIPLEMFGVKVISIGMFVEPGQPLVWRGPMLHSAIHQLLADVDWGVLDYLLVDLPPGTGDIQISLVQIAKVDGAVIVTLPQKVSTDDAHRGIEMFRSLKVPVTGIVENMGSMVLPDGSKYDLFGEGGGKTLAEATGVPYLGSIPIDRDIRLGGDLGLPVTITNPGAASSLAFQQIAAKMHALITVDNN
jgi:ATP-binding protein involved in chromosome partitioning